MVRCACLLALLIVGAAPQFAAADGSWLDDDRTATDFHIWRVNQVSATYTRYGPNDPLCCPVSMASVTFDLQRMAEDPASVPRAGD